MPRMTRPLPIRYALPVGRADRQSGPWGEALQYWLERKNLTQADLVRLMQRRDKLVQTTQSATRLRHIQPNTISRIARGFHTQTAILARIAETLSIALAELLVSPERRLADEERRHYVEQITHNVIAQLDAVPPPAPAIAPPPRVKPAPRRRRK